MKVSNLNSYIVNLSLSILSFHGRNDARSWCLKDPPTITPLPALFPQDQGKLPGEIFSGDDQCNMQYGFGWRMSPYQKVNYTALYNMSHYSRILIGSYL